MAPPLLLLLSLVLPLALSWQPADLTTRDITILRQLISSLASREPPTAGGQENLGFRRWGRSSGGPREPESLESRSQGAGQGGMMTVAREEWIKRNGARWLRRM